MIHLARILTVISGCVIITTMPGTAIALNWNDPDVHLAQSIKDRAFVDGPTSRVVSTKGMPESMRSPATAGGTAAASGAAASGTTPAAVASSAGAASGTAPATAAKGVSNSMKTAKANWGKLSRKGKMIRGLAVIGGGLMMYEGTVGNGPHSWSDVISGAVGGVTTGASIGSLFGPGLGSIIGGAGGAVVGAAVGGAKFFSESGGDCVYDEMLPNVYTCCATVFNKGSRYVDIGGTMLCEMADGNPGVRTCLNGNSTTTHSIFKNDRWSDCQSPDTMWCPGVQKPANDDGVLYVPTLDGVPAIATKKSKIVKDTEEGQLSEEDLKHVKVCWDWVCDDTAGYTKQDNICSKTMKPAPSTDETTIDGMINRLEKLRAEIIKDCGTLGQ